MEDRFSQVQSLLIQTNVIVSSIDSKFQSAQRPDEHMGDAISMALSSYSNIMSVKLWINCFKIDQILFRNNCEAEESSNISVILKSYSWGKFMFLHRPEIAAGQYFIFPVCCLMLIRCA
jgi:hypothetical protein